MEGTLIFVTWPSLPLVSSFCSMEETMRQDARRAPMTFLYATDNKLRSSTVSSTSSRATCFIDSTISSYRSACSAILAMYLRRTSRMLQERGGSDVHILLSAFVNHL